MADVARFAGVHQTTVSRALRNDPRIPAATARRVRAMAESLGYRPHPFVSALIAVRRSRRPANASAVVAYIANPLALPLADELYFSGAQRMAERLGYRVELFRLGDDALSAGRLDGILRSRGIYGVIIGAMESRGENFALTWPHYCTVAIEYTFTEPAFDRVVHDSYVGMRRIMLECERNGFTRVGLLLSHGAHERTERLNAGGYWVGVTSGGRLAPIPPLILPRWDLEAFQAWYRAHRPEAIVTSNATLSQLQRWRARLGNTARRRPAFINVNVPPSGKVPGIAQDPEEIGATALRVLAEKMMNNDTGVPAVQRTTLIPGRWVGTVRHQAADAGARQASVARGNPRASQR